MPGSNPPSNIIIIPVLIDRNFPFKLTQYYALYEAKRQAAVKRGRSECFDLQTHDNIFIALSRSQKSLWVFMFLNKDLNRRTPKSQPEVVTGNR